MSRPRIQPMLRVWRQEGEPLTYMLIDGVEGTPAGKVLTIEMSRGEVERLALALQSALRTHPAAFSYAINLG